MQESPAADANGRVGRENLNGMDMERNGRERVARTGAMVVRMHAHDQPVDVEVRAIVVRHTKGAGLAPMPVRQVGALVGEMRTTIATETTVLTIGCTWTQDALMIWKRIGAQASEEGA